VRAKERKGCRVGDREGGGYTMRWRGVYVGEREREIEREREDEGGRERECESVRGGEIEEDKESV
jgi:hypothetical protein